MKNLDMAHSVIRKLRAGLDHETYDGLVGLILSVEDCIGADHELPRDTLPKLFALFAEALQQERDKGE